MYNTWKGLYEVSCVIDYFWHEIMHYICYALRKQAEENDSRELEQCESKWQYVVFITTCQTFYEFVHKEGCPILSWTNGTVQARFAKEIDYLCMRIEQLFEEFGVKHDSVDLREVVTDRVCWNLQQGYLLDGWHKLYKDFEQSPFIGKIMCWNPLDEITPGI